MRDLKVTHITNQDSQDMREKIFGNKDEVTLQPSGSPVSSLSSRFKKLFKIPQPWLHHRQSYDVASKLLETPMKKLIQSALVAALSLGSIAYAQNVKIVGLVELTGTGATSGTNFDNGIKLAVKEINAAGGILGKKIDYTSFDTQSNPGVAKGLADKAVDDGAYVVMGPVFSGSILVSMASTKRAEIANFTGGEAAAITQQGNPYVFRTSFTQ